MFDDFEEWWEAGNFDSDNCPYSSKAIARMAWEMSQKIRSFNLIKDDTLTKIKGTSLQQLKLELRK